MTPRPTRGTAPAFWRDETTGALAAAIRAYLDNPEALTIREIALLRVYFRQWIAAPSWPQDVVGDLRTRVDTIFSAADIRAWLRDARAVGIDPL